MKQRVEVMIDEVSKVLRTIPEITHLGNPVLRQKCKTVSRKEGQAIGKKLISILEKYRDLSGVGAGLAATQIGTPKKVFVTYGKGEYEVYINPEIVSYSKKTNFYRESCLSSRMMWGDVERSESIEMKWIGEDGKKRKEKFSEFKARLLQHEYDHVLGICCLDKAVSGTVEYSGNVKAEKIRSQKVSK